MPPLKKKIAELQKRPEHERHRAALVYTAVAAVVIGIIWLVILLPIQLYLNRVL